MRRRLTSVLLIPVLLAVSVLIWSCTDEPEPLAPDNGPFSIEVFSPTNNSSVADTVFVTAAVKSEKRIVKVEFFADGVLSSQDYYAPWGFEWITTEYAGTTMHTLKAVAYEWGGFVAGEDEITVTVDNIAPAIITDLAVIDSSTFSATLTWTASGDDSLSGVSSLYDVRYLDAPLTEANWRVASRAEGEPTPGAAGTEETFQVEGLFSTVKYYFGVKAVDEVGGSSDFSNVAVASTTPMFVGLMTLPTDPTAGDNRQISLADVDNDNDLDVVVVKVNNHCVNVFINDGSGNMSDAVRYETLGRFPRVAVMADLDGDTYVDLAVANLVSDDMSILLNNGDGTFGTPTIIPVGNGPRSIQAADLDGDGDNDLVTANRNDHELAVFINNGDASFAAPVKYGAGDSTWSVCVVDLNGDSWLDLAASSRNDHEVCVLLNAGDGTFPGVAAYRVGEEPLAVVAGDLNGDGFPDLFSANFSSNSVSILFNTGTGELLPHEEVEVGTAPRSLCVVDLDIDDDLDLVVLNHESNDMSIFRNAGDGFFHQQFTRETGNLPWSVIAGDIDGDGDNDLIYTLRNDSRVYITLNNLYN